MPRPELIGLVERLLSHELAAESGGDHSGQIRPPDAPLRVGAARVEMPFGAPAPAQGGNEHREQVGWVVGSKVAHPFWSGNSLRVRLTRGSRKRCVEPAASAGKFNELGQVVGVAVVGIETDIDAGVLDEPVDELCGTVERGVDRRAAVAGAKPAPPIMVGAFRQRRSVPAEFGGE
jgi:hypothetical protein